MILLKLTNFQQFRENDLGAAEEKLRGMALCCSKENKMSLISHDIRVNQSKSRKMSQTGLITS